MTLLKTNNSNTNQTDRLSVQISLTGLSFLVASATGKTTSFLEKKFTTAHTPEELLFELKSIFSSETSLQQKFQTVKLIYTTNTYSIVPAALFDEAKASEYLKFNTKILSNDFISYDQISHQSMIAVYVPLVNINNYIFERFGSFEYYHASSLLLQSLLQKEKHHKGTHVYLHLLNKQFDCVIIKNSQLQLCNSYAFNTPEDFIYYVLFCFEQLQLNPESIETVLMGEIDETSVLFEILYTYVRNVSFIKQELPFVETKEAHQAFLLKSTV